MNLLSLIELTCDTTITIVVVVVNGWWTMVTIILIDWLIDWIEMKIDGFWMNFFFSWKNTIIISICIILFIIIRQTLKLWNLVTLVCFYEPWFFFRSCFCFHCHIFFPPKCTWCSYPFCWICNEKNSVMIIQIWSNDDDFIIIIMM